MNLFNKIAKIYEQFCHVLLGLMVSLVIIFVFLRYFFGVTFVWAEELITMLFISTTYFGAVIGIARKEHINISFFYDLFPKKVQKYADILNHIVILGLQVALTIVGFHWIGKVGNVLTTGMRLPIKYFYYMMPISTVLIGIFCIIHITSVILNNKNFIASTDIN